MSEHGRAIEMSREDSAATSALLPIEIGGVGSTETARVLVRNNLDLKLDFHDEGEDGSGLPGFKVRGRGWSVYIEDGYISTCYVREDSVTFWGDEYGITVEPLHDGFDLRHLVDPHTLMGEEDYESNGGFASAVSDEDLSPIIAQLEREIENLKERLHDAE
jgi:hypothetical protein